MIKNGKRILSTKSNHALDLLVVENGSIIKEAKGTPLLDQKLTPSIKRAPLISDKMRSIKLQNAILLLKNDKVKYCLISNKL